MSATTCDACDILVVDDDPTARDLIARVVKRAGHTCTVVGTGAEAFALAQGRAFDLMLLDLRLPDTDGLRLVQALRDQGRSTRTIVLTAQPSLPTALAALSCEVSDYLAKPVPEERLLACISGALRDEGLGNEYLWHNLESKYHFSHVLSHNPATRQVYMTAARVARSRAPIVIGGESGTGKEYLARAVHYLSDRAEQPFVTLNCGAFPEELIENELFGHAKGAYTSASGPKAGLCEVAEGGVLFLDEIGDMSLPMQVKLLRFLNDGTFRRLGGTAERQTDVRIFTASSQDLPQAIREGRFREDLFWRINVIPLYLPPLRERPEDLEPFSRHFLAHFAGDRGQARIELQPGALERLAECAWPGNLRQLHNVLWRAVLLGGPGTVAPEEIVFE